ncbi:MAG: hypothetical protein IH859_04290 [Chloroflexi bacterium]|nr:hypothetical protein [Chloroflexota bacterium]
MRSKLSAGALIAFLLVLFVLPLASLAARSFARLDPERRQQAPVDTSLTLDYYSQLANNPRQ